MKLIRCEINNFGKLNDFKYDFYNGLNTINEDNGFGKTTLATFIKVMFYGFKKSGRTKKETDNERKKFLPWNGAKCSGTLSFEYKGKKYEIQRSFGEKASQDKTKILSLDTNKETIDFKNPDAIGLEIFGIDCESYEKSSYFPQVSDDFSISDDIRKKFTDLVESSDDTLGFNAALNVLEEKKKSYDSNRKDAALKIVNSELTELNEKLEDLNNKYSSLEKIKSDLKEIKNLEFDYKEALKELDTRINKSNGNKALLEIKESLDNKNRRIKQLQVDLDAITKKKIASNEEINETILKVNKLKELENKLVLLNDSPYIKEMNESIIEEVDLESINKKVSDYNSLIVSKINDEILNKYESLDNIYGNNFDKKDIDEIRKELASSKISVLIYIPCVISVLFFLFGIIFIREIFGKIFFLIAILPALIFLLLFFKGKNNNNEKVVAFFKKYYYGESLDDNIKINEIERDYNQYLEYKNIILEENKRSALIISKKELLEEELKEFFNNYSFSYENFNDALATLKYKLERKKELLIEVKKINEEIIDVEKSMNEITIALDSFFTEYNATTASYEESLDVLKKRNISYETLNKNLSREVYEKNFFVKEKKINDEMFDSLEVVEDINKLIEEKEEINKKLEDVISKRTSLDDLVTSITNECEEIDEIVQEIACKEELKRKYEKEVAILDTAICYLKKAKDNLTSSYLRPMEQSFEKYLKIIDDTFDGAVINEDFNIEAKRYGENKEIGYFSKGYVDLLYICIRLSLVDNLFKDEKPVLVLDDPFVNLDEKKINNALKLLNNISEEYQIIYLICHSSRA